MIVSLMEMLLWYVEMDKSPWKERGMASWTVPWEVRTVSENGAAPSTVCWCAPVARHVDESENKNKKDGVVEREQICSQVSAMVVRRGLGALGDPRSHISAFMEPNLDVRCRFLQLSSVSLSPRRGNMEGGMRMQGSI